VFGLHLGLLVLAVRIFFDSYFAAANALVEQLKLIVLIAVCCGRLGYMREFIAFWQG